ncbi:MAG: hypothetical protein AB1763_05015 [Campylobacterota bacterium]
MKPAIFNTEMVRAILDGRKTQTRRIDKRLPSGDIEVTTQFDEQGRCFVFFDGKCFPLKHRLGEVLWVREPAKIIEHAGVTTWTADKIPNITYEYLSDNSFNCIDIPSRFVPIPKWLINCQGIPNGCIREMARTFIRITNIRVERLNEISEEDAIAEGAIKIERNVKGYTNRTYTMVEWHYGNDEMSGQSPSDAFGLFWESIDGKESFDNRYVLVIEFELISKEEAYRERHTT